MRAPTQVTKPVRIPTVRLTAKQAEELAILMRSLFDRTEWRDAYIDQEQRILMSAAEFIIGRRIKNGATGKHERNRMLAGLRIMAGFPTEDQFSGKA